MRQHTPGPWTTIIDNSDMDHPYWYVSGIIDEYEICGLGDPDRVIEQDKANARLIMAAPDLLAALEQIVRIAGPCAYLWYHDVPQWCDAHDLDWPCPYATARAALVKATGQEGVE